MVKSPKPFETTSSDHDDILRAVAARLREARQRMGLTQAELGVRADVKQSYIFELESGERNLTLRTLARMATVFEIDIRELLPETRPSPPSAMRLSLIETACERIAVLLSDRANVEAKLQDQQRELSAQISALADLIKSLRDSAELAPGNGPIEPTK